MKDIEQNLFNTLWKVERFELLEKRQPESIRIEGAVFKAQADSEGKLRCLLIKPEDKDEFIELSSILNIPPTVYEVDGVIHVVGILGSDPCQFHRIIMRFGGFKDGKPWFKFEIIPVYDDCICLPNPGITYLYMSGHGIGGGGGFDN